MVKNDDLNFAIIQTVALYRVATRNTVSALLPENSQPDKRLGKLVKDGLLRVHKGLPGNRSVYQLTKKGAGVAAVSPARGRIIGAQSLLKNLGVLLFCHVPDTERYRVEAEKLSEVMGASLPDAAYCLCKAKGRTIIFDCYVPGPHTPIATVVWHLKKQLRATKRIPVLADAIKDLRYGFVLIVPTAQRRKALMDVIRTRAPDEKLPLVKRVRIWVEAVDELGQIFGSASPSLGSISKGAVQTLLWSDPQ